MPQRWSARQIEALRVIALHGRDPGGLTALAERLQLTPQGLSSILEPLVDDGLIERHALPRAENMGPGRPRVGLIVTKRGAEVVARVENADLGIEACVLQHLTPKERADLLTLLSKAVGEANDNASSNQKEA